MRAVYFIQSLYLNNRLFLLLGSVVILFCASYFERYIFPIAQFSLLGVGVLLIADILILYLPGSGVSVARSVPVQLSLGDLQHVRISIMSRMRLTLKATVVDEAPFQFQLRAMELPVRAEPGERADVKYDITPTERGEYEFGNVNVYFHGLFGLISRRFKVVQQKKCAVYPSILQMKKFELKISSRVTLSQGIKKLRRLGHNNEFEQIKTYVVGDDYRNINWKATSRRHELMVNQFQDEKSQPVYCVIDKSRVMRPAFKGLTLLDHAINASLVVTNIALNKYDRAGLITFSDKIGAVLQADRTPGQLKKIIEVLYRQRTRFLEANYELLFHTTQQYVKGRSLFILFTNFDSLYGLQRVLPILRKINQRHLLMVVFFENTELTSVIGSDVKNVSDIYLNTIAQRFSEEKKYMVNELRKYGIQALLTTPEKLSIDTINKYLELKSRGMI
ncbi:MAG: DUF58 domain-containing protein [Flavobacteriales bacterium]